MRVNGSYEFNNVYLEETATVGGPLEAKGPLGKYFDKTYDNMSLEEISFEHAEMKIQEDTINLLFKKTKYKSNDIDICFGGDLINQDIVSHYNIRNYDIDFCGIYGACSSSVLNQILASIFIDSKNVNRVLCITSSHNLASERQFRSPNEYGGAKSITQTFTVTGGAGAILSNKRSNIKIKKATIGRVIDVGFKNANDMGRAMAPAAIEVLLRHFNDFNITPDYYDLIVTGDLSFYGSEIVHKVLEEKFGIVKNYNDCGLLIYSKDQIKGLAGGSGCACCGVTSYGFIKNEMLSGKYKKVLICATGALMNQDIMLMKESIPSVAHCISWEVLE